MKKKIFPAIPSLDWILQLADEMMDPVDAKALRDVHKFLLWNHRLTHTSVNEMVKYGIALHLRYHYSHAVYGTDELPIDKTLVSEARRKLKELQRGKA